MKITGTIKWYSKRKSYGFIAGDDGKDYFVHRTELPKSYVRHGDKVEFTPAEGDRGLIAKEVALAA